MKRVFLISIVSLLLIGCAQKPMATNVLELSGNQKVVGWKDAKSSDNSKIVVRKIYVEVPFKDSDLDGVPDKYDKCPNTPKNVTVNHEGCPIITTLRLNFDFNKAKVKKIYYPTIKKIAKILKANPKLKIEIAGYTDNIGSKAYNKKLSLRRAKAVRDILVKVYKINPKRIVVKGYGEDYPLVENTTSTNRALNRRVEIINITKNIKKISKPVKKTKKIKQKNKSQKIKHKKSQKTQIIIPPIF